MKYVAVRGTKIIGNTKNAKISKLQLLKSPSIKLKYSLSQMHKMSNVKLHHVSVFRISAESISLFLSNTIKVICRYKLFAVSDYSCLQSEQHRRVLNLCFRARKPVVSELFYLSAA